MEIGTIVKCVRNDFCTFDWNVKIPKVNSIYTIREIREFFLTKYFLLEEIVNDCVNSAEGFTEPSFNENAFIELLPPIANIEEKIKEETLELQPI